MLAIIERHRPGKQAFASIAGDRVVYLDWPLGHPEPKFEAYSIRLSALTGASDQLVADVTSAASRTPRPAVGDGAVLWVSQQPGGPAALFRRSLSGGDTAQLPVPEVDLLPPLLIEGSALVGARGEGGAFVIKVVAPPG